MIAWLERWTPRRVLGLAGALFTLGMVSALVRPWAAGAALRADLQGKVLDADSGAAVAGATVSLPDLGLQTVSDGAGAFTLRDIPLNQTVQPTTIRVDAAGYGTWTLLEARLIAGDTLILTVDLRPEPVTIQAPKPRWEDPSWPAEQLAQVQSLAAPLHDQRNEPLPATIRVRVTGYPYCDLSRPYTVEVVDFKEYVKHVLPNEWNPSWPRESLRAGAMAAKMYAWSIVAAGGKWSDADVYDSTCDQVYNPNIEYGSTNRAVDFTWNWRLTWNADNHLVRAYYRTYYSQCVGAGLAGQCMGQVESRDHAQDGWTWEDILFQYYPNTSLSAVVPSPGGYALRFYGNGYGDIDRVKIPLDNPARPVDVGDDFTLEFWLKALPGENAAGPVTCGANDNWIYGNILFDRDVFGDGDYGDYGVSLADGRVVFGVARGANATTICGATAVDDGAWHHVAVTRRASDGRLQIYVDGASDAEGTGPTGDISYRDGRSTSYPNDPYLVIGAEKHDADNTLYPSYSGWLDEVRLSDTVRYDGPFTPPPDPFTPDADTVGLYHFDEGVGNTINDSSGAPGGPSNGIRKYGGVTNGPEWTTDSPWYVPPPFADVPPSHWAYSAINALYEAGYVAGCAVAPERLFCPSRSLTRAEAAVLVLRGRNGQSYWPPEAVEQIFADVPLSSWYARWVHALWQSRFTSGCQTDPLYYCPLRALSRAEAAVLFVHLLYGDGYSPPEPTSQVFEDVPLSAWYAPWVHAAYGAGLTQGCQTSPPLRYCPNDPLTRAMAAVMMVQVLSKLP